MKLRVNGIECDVELDAGELRGLVRSVVAAVLAELDAETAARKKLDRGVLLTRSEAAEYLGVAAGTLACWAVTGAHDLPFERVGRQVRYRKADLDRWLDGQRRTRTP